jgi:CheY-like chemotaxis protein
MASPQSDRPGKDAQVTNGQRVLVVDGLSETEEVLKAVLEPQGLEVNRIRTHSAPKSPAALPPHLVILHEDHATKSPAAKDSWPDIPRVIIGSMHLPRRQSMESLPREQYLSQPFQYRDLINAVEQLLAD